MGRLRDMLPGRSAASSVARARRQLATGAIDDAVRTAERGLAAHPGASQLREILLTARRVKAKSKIQRLRLDVVRDNDPAAYAELTALYESLEMSEQARQTAVAFTEHHPDHPRAHRALGEMALATFVRSIDSRAGYEAHKHLRRAIELEPEGLKTWLLLGELYFCVDEAARLAEVAQHLEALGGGQEEVEQVLEAIEPLADASADTGYEGMLERIEVEGHLPRDPSAWPLRTARNDGAGLAEHSAKRAVRRAIKQRLAREILVLRSNGSRLAHGSDAEQDIDEDRGLARIMRSLSRTLLHQVREFDLGDFRRCAVEGPFGQIVVGRHDEELVAAHHERMVEPDRLWIRVASALDEARGGAA